MPAVEKRSPGRQLPAHGSWGVKGMMRYPNPSESFLWSPLRFSVYFGPWEIAAILLRSHRALLLRLMQKKYLVLPITVSL